MDGVDLVDAYIASAQLGKRGTTAANALREEVEVNAELARLIQDEITLADVRWIIQHLSDSYWIRSYVGWGKTANKQDMRRAALPTVQQYVEFRSQNESRNRSTY